jgi:hypothetical protein
MKAEIRQLSSDQQEILDLMPGNKVFLEGPAGCGKTTTAVEAVLSLMAREVAGDSILVLVPQRTLAEPFSNGLKSPGVISGGLISILTIGGLARRMIDLFWPLIDEQAGFKRSGAPPTFLTLETAQYFMARVVAPLLDRGYFSSVVMDRNRLFSQIIDNLNKASVVGFPHTEIASRLSKAWSGEPGQLRIYQDVQDCASRFRELCYSNNLLDFSLQIEVFTKYVWMSVKFRDYLHNRYRHLIVDNLEEDIPITHDLLSEWLQNLDSGLFIYDWDAGFRTFLGADPNSANNLRACCAENRVFNQTFVCSEDIQMLKVMLADAIERPGTPLVSGPDNVDDIEKIVPDPSSLDINGVLVREYHRFYPEMLDWVVDQTDILINEEGYLPSEIVILSPFMTDSLRFALEYRLARKSIPSWSHRPSRSLREEPAVLCLLTLINLAHPQWGIVPPVFDFSYALMQAIYGLDLVRAQLLSEIVYRLKSGAVNLSPFESINPKMMERITSSIGERYDTLRIWLEENSPAGQDDLPLDYFISKLFGELLSQPGFGFYADPRKGELTANLIESVRKFRRVVEGSEMVERDTIGMEYIRMVSEGVIAAQYLRSWSSQPEEAVFISPAYTFLLRNRSASVQFWLDIGSRSWYQRVFQPLTHPHVLSRNWSLGSQWTDRDEAAFNQRNLTRLTAGLLRRCKKKIYLGLSDLGDQGYEQRGALLNAFQRVLRDNHANV